MQGDMLQVSKKGSSHKSIYQYTGPLYLKENILFEKKVRIMIFLIKWALLSDAKKFILTIPNTSGVKIKKPSMMFMVALMVLMMFYIRLKKLRDVF